MKRIILFAVTIAIVASGCKKNNIEPSGEELSVKVKGKTVITSRDIDYYDLSTHFIYLNKTSPFFNQKQYADSFQVFVGNDKIYSGVFFPIYASSIPVGASISVPDMFHGDYIVPIAFHGEGYIDNKQAHLTDRRSDSRILKALESRKQLHEGLKCKIKSVKISEQTKVALELELTNNDSFNYYYLDPAKMGQSLYHYFTTGLIMSNKTVGMVNNNVRSISPEPFDSWKKEWLSLIHSGEKKLININYTDYSPLKPGKYSLYFSFPGLSKVNRADLKQKDGHIWLGNLNLSSEIEIQ